MPYTPQPSAGNWIPTPPGFQPALLPQWANLAPFAITSDSQFRPSGLPPLTSSDYTIEFNQVKELGEKNSSARTPEGTEIALFWADGAGTYTPPGHWNQIAQQASLKSGSTLLEDARMFALLNIALADAGIVAWDAKYAYDFWRPVLRGVPVGLKPYYKPVWRNSISFSPSPHAGRGWGAGFRNMQRQSTPQFFQAKTSLTPHDSHNFPNNDGLQSRALPGRCDRKCLGADEKRLRASGVG
ncbi:MAG: vanadium-dependent haloperoxidase [Oscillatoria princeps RMCB-10]|nr:vanadium-dependent haloperoxidase [Oscillatoria princeps RMCB-10]